jgi:hypothetical protein
MDALPLSPIELAAGTPIGPGTPRPPFTGPPPASVRAAVEAVVRRALARPPCVVGFSGGRESSLLLALAVAVARREGLDEPRAVTYRFPEAPGADEAAWQERVAAHLRLERWERLELGDELDVLGALAQAGMRRHGLLWGPVSHFVVPQLERARGGSLLVPVAGPQVLGEWRFARHRAVLAARVRPAAADLARVAVLLGPEALRHSRTVRGLPASYPWLTPAALREMAAVTLPTREPRRWDRWLGWYLGRRAIEVEAHSLRLLAADQNVAVHAPFLDRGVAAALASRGGRPGPWPAHALRAELAGGLLPGDVLRRPGTRAEYGPILWGPRARAFAASWDGEGVDPALVDADALRRIWAGPPWLHAAAVLQAVWFARAATF